MEPETTTTDSAGRSDPFGGRGPILPARTINKVTELQKPVDKPLVKDNRVATFSEDSRLLVGRHIRLKGEITNCQVLTVEGQVEAAFSGRLLEVSDKGLFRGSATVETADVHGRIHGELVVTKLLRIHGGGQVNGKIRYKRLEILPGGEIAGEIAVGEAAEPVGITLAEARFEAG